MMKSIKTNRRSFFLKGSAAVGAGLAATSASASGLLFDGSLPLKEQVVLLQQQLSRLEDREAIRQLTAAYAALLDNGAHDAVGELFTRDARLNLQDGTFKNGQVRQFFAAANRSGSPEVVQTAFRLDPARQQDAPDVHADGLNASAMFQCRVEVSIPHDGNSTLTDMARLQGQFASSRWMDGNIAMTFRKEGDHWKISGLEFLA